MLRTSKGSYDAKVSSDSVRRSDKHSANIRVQNSTKTKVAEDFLLDEEASPTYPDKPCDRCKGLRIKGKEYCVIGGGESAKDRCARCLLAGSPCSFNPMRTRARAKAESPKPKATTSKPSTLGKRKAIVLDSDSDDDSGPIHSAKVAPVGKLEQVLALLAEMNQRQKRIERKVERMEKKLNDL
jgi:hypothetical protein